MKDKELKYCCDRFEISATRAKTTNPNIRIVKLTSPHYFKQYVEKKFRKNPLRFFLTQGFLEEFRVDLTGNISIMYCPYCGKDLYKFYKDDAYANEIEGQTFFDGYKPEE